MEGGEATSRDLHVSWSGFFYMNLLIARWAEAYNNHDVESLIELYDEEVVNVQQPYSHPVQGMEAMREVFRKTFLAFPDIHIDIEKALEQEDGAAIEWIFSGTMRGEFAGHPPTGRRFSMRGCEVFRFREGLIVSQHGYWDKQTMFSQLGI